ncbi:MAG TPA: DUF1501 domain-containing protein [Planctomycetota bacterium]|nr:DUF1501 domain-containing protein [Planctomycetota bacterium]
MLHVPGPTGRLCDGVTRRDFLGVGSLSLIGLTLPQFLALKARAAAPAAAKTLGEGTFGKAKSVILIYLQGGPSHIDIWDPKPDAPQNIRGEFHPIPTVVPGIQLSETMPKLAREVDKATLIRSMSYSPNGLFNHTAAMYQMLTGYTPDKVSPSGQLEPPAPNDFPTAGSHVAKMRPPEVAMLPFVMLPRPLQESNVIGKGGSAGFLGKAYDPYYLFQDPNQKLNVGDLAVRSDVPLPRLERRANLLRSINASMPQLERAVKSSAVDKYYEKAFDLILSGNAREAFNLDAETDKVRERYGRHTFGQSCLLARRLIQAGTRFVQVNWPAVANGNPMVDAWDTHAANFGPLRDLHCPKLDSGLSALLNDLDSRGMLEDTLVVAVGEFGRSPRLGVSTSGNGNAKDGRDHWPYCYTALVAGAGVGRGKVYGKSDEHASSPVESAVHPQELLATIYHALGIDPATEVMNHLNQPRPLVKGEPVLGLFA